MTPWQIATQKANEFRLIHRRTRTGFVGLGQSGKTTLMTAILDRVRKRDGKKEKRRLGEVTHRTGRLPPLPPDPSAFPYDAYLESLTAGQAWPSKTRVATRCAYLHYLEGANVVSKSYADNVIEEHLLLDIPGERVADFTMAGQSFATWSDMLLGEIAKRPEYYGRAEPFFDLTETPHAAADDVIRAYKGVLAEFARSAIPLVTPSSFLIHPAGKYPVNVRDAMPHKLTHEYLVQRGIVGLNEARQFAPLTQAARQANPHLVEAFCPHFEDYRGSIGEAMAQDFYACDNLVVLVDIAAILGSGPKTYHATRNCIKRLLEVLDPGHTGGQYFKDWALTVMTGGRKGVKKIDNVAFVATKADDIHSLQRHRLYDLLRTITVDLLPVGSAARWMHCRSFAVAAIEAAQDAPSPPYVQGYVRRNGVTSATREVLKYPHELPREWPPESRWQEDDFAFGGFVPPPLDTNGSEFWPAFGMDALVEYLGLLRV
jgi:predicted YcjX-like family ATPase